MVVSQEQITARGYLLHYGSKTRWSLDGSNLIPVLLMVEKMIGIRLYPENSTSAGGLTSKPCLHTITVIYVLVTTLADISITHYIVFHAVIPGQTGKGTHGEICMYLNN